MHSKRCLKAVTTWQSLIKQDYNIKMDLKDGLINMGQDEVLWKVTVNVINDVRF
jgi:hypothetical protein